MRDFETQFMCGDTLLVAPDGTPGGERDIALPPGAGTTSTRGGAIAGRQVMRYTATLDQFPVFGREGHVLPLGRARQHTGEIDRDASAGDALGLRQARAAAGRFQPGEASQRGDRAAAPCSRMPT